MKTKVDELKFFRFFNPKKTRIEILNLSFVFKISYIGISVAPV